MSRHALTADYVRSILDYDPETGIFRWRVRSDVPDSWNTKYAGKIVSCTSSCGYLRVGINYRRYALHRLAWLCFYGEWPAEQIDHINCIKTDNKIVNLRQATPAENRRNVPARRNNVAGFKGVHWHKPRSKWLAQIRFDRKNTYLGLFDTPEEAHAAYCEAAKRCHGDFFRSE